MERIKLFNDHFQNYKVYGIPKAQLVLTDIPYNVGNNAYGSNPQYNPEYRKGSKYDALKIESRSVIIFYNYEWRLDIENDFNKRILELKGNETEKRRLSIRIHLKDYDFFQKSNPSWEWNRENNSHAYWSDIEVIGNIHENPELLEVQR